MWFGSGAVLPKTNCRQDFPKLALTAQSDLAAMDFQWTVRWRKERKIDVVVDAVVGIDTAPFVPLLRSMTRSSTPSE